LKTIQFVKFDFGSPEQNMDHYGSETPPNYDLAQVTAPTAIFFGEKDDLVKKLLSYIGSPLL
jgi:hypothetical protein